MHELLQPSAFFTHSFLFLVVVCCDTLSCCSLGRRLKGSLKVILVEHAHARSISEKQGGVEGCGCSRENREWMFFTSSPCAAKVMVTPFKVTHLIR